MSPDGATRTSGFLPWLELGDFRIQSYFVIISLIFSLAAFWIPHRARPLGLDRKRALDLYIGIMVFGFLGSRLLHIFWEEPRYYLDDPWRVFDIVSGGFVWFGGSLASVLFLWLRLRRDPERNRWLDFFAPMAAAGYAAGRFACFLTGCCFGEVCHWTLGESEWLFHFPTQLMAVIWELGLFFFLAMIERQRHSSKSSLTKVVQRFSYPGALFDLWLFGHGAGRIVMEWFRADPRGPGFGPVSLATAIGLVMLVWGAARIRRARSAFRS